MKLYDIIRRIYPTKNGPIFRKVRTEIDVQDVKDSDVLFPSTIELRLIEPDLSACEISDFMKHVSVNERQVYNSPNETIPIPVDISPVSSEKMSGFHELDETGDTELLNSRRSEEASIYFYQTNPTHSENNGSPEAKKCRLIYGSGIFAILMVVILIATCMILRDENTENAFDKHFERQISNPTPPSKLILDSLVLVQRQWPLPDINSLRAGNHEINRDIFKDNDFNTEPSTRSTLSVDETMKPTVLPKKATKISSLKFPIVGETVVAKIKDIRQSLTDAREEIKSESYSKRPLMNSPERENTNSNVDFENDQNPSVVDKRLLMEKTYRIIVKKMELTKMEASEGQILLNMTIPLDLCSPISDISDNICNDREIYRTLDGSCNNLRNVMWGSTNEPYRRILFPDYDDGISSPRALSVNKSILPGPREISQMIHIDEYREDISASLMFPLWAHFVDHDLSYTASSENFDDFRTSQDQVCCDREERNNTIYPDNCFPINIKPDDPFYNSHSHNVTCMDFIRADPYGNCRLGPREQFNKMTAYLDASHIYGTTKELTDSLRLNKSGALKITDTDEGLNLLPSLTNATDPCNQKFQILQGHFCFRSGDPRVNQVATLTTLHTIWVRQHNRISEALSNHNPQWTDEKIFQEARRIVIAQIQFITYNEFLPELLSEELIEKADLKLKTEGYYKKYDSTIDPTISNAFTLAFRFRYSMIQGLLRMVGPNGKNQDYIQVHKFDSNPFLLWKDGKMDAMLRGASTQGATKVDAFVSGQLTHHINQRPNSTYGLDLIAITLQKGRDQGLPAYTQWRKACGLSKVEIFDDLKDIWEEDARTRTFDTFKFVEDIDLYTGMLAEIPAEGARIGPTLSCILADQFVRLKKGDMFWFEGDIRMNHFTPEQLNSIRSTTLARIMCDNSDDIREMQAKVMLKPSPDNPIEPCFILPKVNYNPWKVKVSQVASKKKSGSHHKDDQNSKKTDKYGEIYEIYEDSEDSVEHETKKESTQNQGILLDFKATPNNKGKAANLPSLIIFNRSENKSTGLQNDVH